MPPVGGVRFAQEKDRRMGSATLDDPDSLVAVYPRAQFERDAARNAEVKTATLSGLVLLSAPDAAGRFELDRATRHGGEVAQSADTVFLYPMLGDAAGGLAGKVSAYGAEAPTAPRPADYGGLSRPGDGRGAPAAAAQCARTQRSAIERVQAVDPPGPQ